MQGIEEHRQRAFSLWLRTGRRVRDPDNREIERKFNPWHDPRDGRFTFAESGVRSGAGGAGTARPARSRVPKNQPKVQYVQDFGMAPLASIAEVEAWRARELAKYRGKPGYAEAIEAQYRRYQQAFAPRPDSTLNNAASAAVDLARGVGAGVVDTGKDTAASVRTAVTTNPVTTVQNVERGIASTIDRAISAEDVPASVQIGRAVDAIANASAYDVGYTLGSIGADVALAVVPGVAAGKIAAVRRVRRIADAIPPKPAAFGTSTSRNYRATFFSAFPGTKGSVVVHHAVEKEVLKKYPGVVSGSEIHSLEIFEEFQTD